MLKTQPAMAPYDFCSFSTKLLNDLLSQYNFFEPKFIYIGCFLMVIYSNH